MIWKIILSQEAEKFLTRQHLPKEEVFELARRSIRKLQGEDINVDIKKLKGEWSGFYRSRAGKLRVIMEFDFDNLSAFVERVDYRGSVYR